nr:DUF4293 family protein [Flavobacterium sp. J372]
MCIISIFTYKKRQKQFVMNRLNILLNLILLGLFIYQSLNLSGETDPEKVVSREGYWDVSSYHFYRFPQPCLTGL